MKVNEKTNSVKEVEKLAGSGKLGVYGNVHLLALWLLVAAFIFVNVFHLLSAPVQVGSNSPAGAGGSRYMVGTRGKGEVSTGTNHLGFRCVSSAGAKKMTEQKPKQLEEEQQQKN